MKFAITPAQRAALMAQLGSYLRADENAGDGARYPVVSLYYDNAERDCYWDKARSLPSRRKLRVRVYAGATMVRCRRPHLSRSSTSAMAAA